MNHSLASLIGNLSNSPPDDLRHPLRVADAVSRHLEGLLNLPRAAAAPGRYHRTLLHRDHAFEMLVLDWGAGSFTPVHDHAKQACMVVVLEGSIAIEDYVLDESGVSAGVYGLTMAAVRDDLRAGATDYRKKDFDIHVVRCAGTARTIHVYSKPIDCCGTYDLERRTRTETTLKYDSIYQAGISAAPAAWD